MNIEFKKVESTYRPEELDTTTSKCGVYIRKNIEQKTRQFDPEIEDEEVYYEYEEAYLTKEEYSLYKIEQEVDSKNTEIQLAIAELAEYIMKGE